MQTFQPQSNSLPVAPLDPDALLAEFQFLAIEPASNPSPPPSPLVSSFATSSPLVSSLALSATSASIQSLIRWWTDSHFGPLADANPDSWLRAFPSLDNVEFGSDGVVTISQKDCSPASVEQAARARKHIEKVTQKLQYLRCDSCGNHVASVEKSCCERKGVSNCVESTFRMSGDVIDSIFEQSWCSASEHDAAQWLEVHSSGTKDRSGKCILPALLTRSPDSKLLEQQVVTMLNDMDPISARLTTQSCFRQRPFTLMASTFKCKFASAFADNVSLSLSSTCSEKAPSYSSRFGKVIDKQMKWAVKRGVEDRSLPDGWSDAEASFGELPYAPLRGVQLCQETDALFNNHVVEFKTLDAVSFQTKPSHKQESALSEYVRQMAVSQTLLRASNAGSFLVLIGRDHRVLVLEDTGARDAAGLPRAFAWLKNTLDYWFRSDQPFAAFLKQFAAAVAPYTLQSAQRKLEWDRDHAFDFSGWNCLNTLMAPVVARLNDAKDRAKVETKRRMQL
jgi:hypothetical protein